MCPIGYKRGHKRGHKEGYICLIVILAKINNTKFNSIGLGLSLHSCREIFYHKSKEKSVFPVTSMFFLFLAIFKI